MPVPKTHHHLPAPLSTEADEGGRYWLAPALVLSQVASLQGGSAVAKGLFDVVGPTRTACLRLWFAAAITCALVRPRPWRFTRPQLAVSVGLGGVVVAMNVTYFHAIAVLPLGVAATLELLGPLGVAVVFARSGTDLLFASLAVGGTVLLVAPTAGTAGGTGLVLGLGSALLRGAYLLLTSRVGQLFADWSGLATALAVGALLAVPIGTLPRGETGPGKFTDPADLAVPAVLALGLAVGLLCAVIPYGLDLVALRRISPRVLGVLLSMSPAVGTLVGFAALGERLTPLQLLALACVTTASVGVVLQRAPRRAVGEV